MDLVYGKSAALVICREGSGVCGICGRASLLFVCEEGASHCLGCPGVQQPLAAAGRAL